MRWRRRNGARIREDGVRVRCDVCPCPAEGIDIISERGRYTLTTTSESTVWEKSSGLGIDSYMSVNLAPDLTGGCYATKRPASGTTWTIEELDLDDGSFLDTIQTFSADSSDMWWVGTNVAGTGLGFRILDNEGDGENEDIRFVNLGTSPPTTRTTSILNAAVMDRAGRLYRTQGLDYANLRVDSWSGAAWSQVAQTGTVGSQWWIGAPDTDENNCCYAASVDFSSGTTYTLYRVGSDGSTTELHSNGSGFKALTHKNGYCYWLEGAGVRRVTDDGLGTVETYMAGILDTNLRASVARARFIL